MTELTQTFVEKGDLAHLALFLWASFTSVLLVWSLRELVRANLRFNQFVAEIARLNNFLAGRLL